MASKRKESIRVRVDKKVWERCRKVFGYPYEAKTDGDISRLLFNSSMAKYEAKLESIKFKDKMGEFIYGKNVWKKSKKQKR